MKPRRITIVTTARSDFGIYLPVLHRLQSAGDVDLAVWVAGMHLAPEFGLTVREIEKHGFTIAERIEMLVASDSPQAIAKSIGLGVIGYAQALERSRPDILVVLGDRFEMYAAAVAALPYKVPVAHIHGGELTFGAIDDSLRHSMTKLSHLHFPAASEYGDRIIRMGEAPWRVHVCGAPALDHIASIQLLPVDELESRLELPFHPAPLLVTYHPVTLEHEHTAEQVESLVAALAMFDRPILITQPNADTSGRVITSRLREFARSHSNVRLVDNLGTQVYFSVMAHAAAMVGNSSSGLIEAPSFDLPVVNIGNRQRGRVRAANVIDVGCGRDEIAAGIAKALSPEFRRSLRGLKNPYGDGRAAERIAAVLRRVELGQRLIEKEFHDG